MSSRFIAKFWQICKSLKIYFLKRKCMANVNNTNVYIGKSKNRSQWGELSLLWFLVELGLVNGGIKVSTDTASMILRKYEQSVLQSLCSIGQHFVDFFCLFFFFLFHCMQFVFIENALSKIKPMRKSMKTNLTSIL